MNIWDTNAEWNQTRNDINRIIEEHRTSRDLYYLAGLVMAAKYASSGDNISTLFTLVDGKSLQRLCKVLGGKTITIPTYEQLIDSLKLIKFTYEYSTGKTIRDSLLEAGYELKDLERVAQQYTDLTKELMKIESKQSSN